MKCVLVTGANGFVGRHLVSELAARGMSVVGVGGPIGPSGIPAGLTSYLELDLSDPAAAAKIDYTEVDSVIHLAGLAAVNASFDEPMRYINVNVGIQVNLFEAALAQKATPRMLVISSATLYDPKASLPITEQSAVLPGSPYAVSKIGQEQMAFYYQNRGFQCLIARAFNHIGPGQGEGFIVPDLAKQIVAAERGGQATVTVGNLDTERDYTDVRDIVRAYCLLLENGRPGEIYNVCSGQTYSGHTILDGLLKLTEAKPEIVQDTAKMRPSDVPILSGSHQKLTDDTGWQPEISLETTLADVMADWRSRSD